jgi:hypothetical protein
LRLVITQAFFSLESDTTRKEPEKAPHFSGLKPDLQKIFPGFRADKKYMLGTTK